MGTLSTAHINASPKATEARSGPRAFAFASLRASRRPSWVGYAVAIAAFAAGMVNVALVQTTAPVATFVLAVVVSTWFGGTKSGLLATALSTSALAYLLPAEGWPIDAAPLYGVAYFLMVAFFIVWIIGSERNTAEVLRHVRDELQWRNAALQKENLESKALEDVLRENERQLRLVIDTIPAMAWSILPNGKLEFVNRRWLDYTGLSLAEAIENPHTTIHPEDRSWALEKWAGVQSAGTPYEEEIRVRSANGEYRWFLVRVIPLLDDGGKILRWYGTSTDIEDRKRAERSARDSTQRLRLLSRSLFEVQEDERRHLARELHDEFAQLLATINVHLHAARQITVEAARARLDECIGLLQSAGDQMRSLALELRPAMLETSGLDAALRWLAQQHEQRTDVETRIIGHVEGITGEMANCCFRLTQQALTNVAQHAQAHHIRIELTQDERSLRLVVLDDGVGFAVANALTQFNDRSHLGLLGMRERVELLGGRLRIESKPGSGTRIDVLFALSAATARATTPMP